MVTKDKMINNNKEKGYNKIFKNAKNTEKCIFCYEEHLRETIWEGVNQENSEQNWIPLCKRCHVCLKDATVMEMREAMERGRDKMNWEVEKVEYFYGICQEIINNNQISINCTKCQKWIHMSCTKFNSCKEAKKHQYDFKCKNCDNEDKTPKIINKNKDLNVKNVEDMTDEV